MKYFLCNKQKAATVTKLLLGMMPTKLAVKQDSLLQKLMHYYNEEGIKSFISPGNLKVGTENINQIGRIYDR